MKKCKYHRRAYLYVAGMLDERERARFESHLATCAECARIVESEKSLKALYAKAGRVEPSAGFQERVLGRVGREARDMKPAYSWDAAAFARKLIPVAACIAVIMFIAILFGPHETAQQTTVAASSYNYVAMQLNANERSLVLENGTDAYGVLYNYFDSVQ